MSVYDLGDVAALSVTVKDSDGVLANAGAVACTVTLPDGSTVSPTVTNVSTGIYSVAYTPLVAGRFSVRWVATGVNASAYSDVFDVLATNPRFIVSLAGMRQHLGLNAANTTHDEELREYLAAATDVIEAITGPVLPATVTETHDGGKPALLLRNAPVTAVTSVTESGTVLSATDYTLDPYAGTLARTVGLVSYVWAYGRSNVQVTYTVGGGVVPGYIILAARELVRHWYQRGRQSPRPAFGGSTPDDGSQYVAGYAIPNYVVGMLDASSGLPGIA